MTDAERWQERAVISFEQAERLEAEPPPDPLGGTRTAEVLGYIGAIATAIATVALVIKVSFSGDPLEMFLGTFDNIPGGIVALVGALLVFGTGYRFAAGEGAVRRASGFLLLSGYLLSSIGFGLLLFDLDLGDFTPLVVIIPSAIVAVAGFLRLRSVPTQLALFVATVGAVSAILVLIQVEDRLDPSMVAATVALTGTVDFGSWISHLVNAGLGVAWIWLGLSGVLRPRNAALFIGSIYAVGFGLALFTSADGWVVLSGALALGLLWGAMHWRSSVLGAVGAVAAIVAVFQLMTLVYEDAPGTTEFIVWFGIPGLFGLAAVWVLATDGSRGESTTATPTLPTTPAESEPEGSIG